MIEEQQKSKTWKGPRNLPKSSERKRRRREQRAKRRANRGKYCGQ